MWAAGNWSEESSGKFLKTVLELLTEDAVLPWKVLSWISTLAPLA
jgi:hypothetical protein